MNTLYSLINEFGAEAISLRNETIRGWLGETNVARFQQRLVNESCYQQIRAEQKDCISLFGLANLIDQKRNNSKNDIQETTMNSTTLSLLAQFGSAIIPFADVVEKYIGISCETAIRQIKAGDLRLNIFRLSDRQKAPYLVHVDDLSSLLEMKRAEAMSSLQDCAAQLALTRGNH